MAIHLKSKENSFIFAEQLYLKAQVLVTCGKFTMEDAITAAISSVAAHHILQLYLNVIKRLFTFIQEIKEALLDIPPIFSSPLLQLKVHLIHFHLTPVWPPSSLPMALTYLHPLTLKALERKKNITVGIEVSYVTALRNSTNAVKRRRKKPCRLR